jgi:hypothetical protein
MVDDLVRQDPVAPEVPTGVEEPHAAELRRVRAERDEALLKLLELEQEIARHVCGAVTSPTRSE